MVENRQVNAIKQPTEKCPECGASIHLKTEGSSYRLVLYNLDGTIHRCESTREFDKHPIGRQVAGAVVKQDGFQLRGRVLTISFEDGNVLSVSAAGRPLTISLNGPAGIMQE